MEVCYTLGLLQQKAITPLDILPYSLPQPYAIMLRSGGNNTINVNWSQEAQTSYFQAPHLYFSSLASFSRHRQVEQLLVQESKPAGCTNQGAFNSHSIKMLQSCTLFLMALSLYIEPLSKKKRERKEIQHQN